MTRIVVTGAAGQIAYHLLFSLASGKVFGDQQIHLHLVDIEAMTEKLESVVMELEDCAFPLLQSVSIFNDSDLDAAFKDIDFAFLVGASPRQKGMERSDLLAKNGEIFKQQGIALSHYAKTTVKVLVVGNPCNTNCLIAMHHAKNIPNTQFFAMTLLDEHRARTQIAKYTGRDVADVAVSIYGNHSNTQYPDIENAGVDTTDSWYETVFIPMIQNRGAAVIAKRKASSAASAAYAAVVSAQCLVQPSSRIFSIASISNGQYGAPKGLIVSFPHIHDTGVQIKEGYQHSALAKSYINSSYQELQSEYEQVKALGLLDD